MLMPHRIAFSVLRRVKIKKVQVVAYNRMPPEMRRFFHDMQLAMQNAMQTAQSAKLQQTCESEE
jgi:hypothetical protein